MVRKEVANGSTNFKYGCRTLYPDIVMWMDLFMIGAFKNWLSLVNMKMIIQITPMKYKNLCTVELIVEVLQKIEYQYCCECVYNIVMNIANDNLSASDSELRKLSRYFEDLYI
ncbi:hypothetical protein C0J52_03588 [Blattella germanica]|nr:hypothetical protein C0J52_03588 [Blattella germanica]